MQLHLVKTYPSTAKLNREDQLAWKLAELATSGPAADADVAEMVGNRIVDNAAVAIAAINRAPVKNARLQALAHPRPGGARLFGVPGAELVCDAHTPFVIWADNLHLALARVKARMHWKLKDPRDVETWGAGFRLLDEWNYYCDDEPLMKPFLWLRLIPGLARSSGIYHYRLGMRP